MNILNSIHNMDVSTFYWLMARKHRQIMTRASRVVSMSADGPLYVLLAISMWSMGYSQCALIIAVGFTIERILYLLLKKSFKRNRHQGIFSDLNIHQLSRYGQSLLDYDNYTRSFGLGIMLSNWL